MRMERDQRTEGLTDRHKHTDRQTDMTKLILVFLSFAKAPRRDIKGSGEFTTHVTMSTNFKTRRSNRFRPTSYGMRRRVTGPTVPDVSNDRITFVLSLYNPSKHRRPFAQRHNTTFQTTLNVEQ
jgi:hypothetical protein